MLVVAVLQQLRSLWLVDQMPLVVPVCLVVQVRPVVQVESCVGRRLLRRRSWLVRIALASLGLGEGGVDDSGGIPSRLLCERGSLGWSLYK